MRYFGKRLFWILVTACIYAVVFHHGGILAPLATAAEHGMHSVQSAVSSPSGNAGANVALPSGDRAVAVGFSPGNAEGLVVQTIDGARESVNLAAYSFTSAPIAEALVRAAHRGVTVRVVMDKSQRTERYTSATFLANAGIPVRIDAEYAIMHNKFAVIDGVTVETGSFNYTRAAQAHNAENVLVLRNVPDVARTYDTEWNRLWAESSPYQARS